MKLTNTLDAILRINSLPSWKDMFTPNRTAKQDELNRLFLSDNTLSDKLTEYFRIDATPYWVCNLTRKHWEKSAEYREMFDEIIASEPAEIPADTTPKSIHDVGYFNNDSLASYYEKLAEEWEKKLAYDAYAECLHTAKPLYPKMKTHQDFISESMELYHEDYFYRDAMELDWVIMQGIKNYLGYVYPILAKHTIKRMVCKIGTSAPAYMLKMVESHYMDTLAEHCIQNVGLYLWQCFQNQKISFSMLEYSHQNPDEVDNDYINCLLFGDMFMTKKTYLGFWKTINDTCRQARKSTKYKHIGFEGLNESDIISDSLEDDAINLSSWLYDFSETDFRNIMMILKHMISESQYNELCEIIYHVRRGQKLVSIRQGNPKKYESWKNTLKRVRLIYGFVSAYQTDKLDSFCRKHEISDNTRVRYLKKLKGIFTTLSIKNLSIGNYAVPVGDSDSPRYHTIKRQVNRPDMLAWTGVK